jgi:hypothetical protein
MRKLFYTLIGAIGIFTLPICSQAAPLMIAKYTSVEPDAELVGDSWKNAPEYPFQPYTAGSWYADIERANGMNRQVLEPGTIKLLWDEKFFYVGLKMTDSDLVGEAQRDQTHIFTKSDAVELFLKPGKCPHYWEIYGSVNNKKTCYFFPGRGRLGLPSNNVYKHNLKVKAAGDGTLNNWSDRDKTWTLLLKVPVADLTRHGAKWNNAEEWTIHLVRYNYSIYLPSKEVSVYPEFKANNPHFYEGYARLILQK